MDKGSTFTVVVGGCTVVEHTADGKIRLKFGVGPTYYHTPERFVNGVQNLYDKHEVEINEGLDGFIDDMKKLGFANIAGDDKAVKGKKMLDEVIGDDAVDEDVLTEKQRRKRARQAQKDAARAAKKAARGRAGNVNV